MKTGLSRDLGEMAMTMGRRAAAHEGMAAASRQKPQTEQDLNEDVHTIALVHKWYEVASRFEKSRAELAKAQKSFDFFQNQFENVGKSLSKAQEAFDKATTHLKAYRGKVTALSGQEQLELDNPPEAKLEEKPQLPLIDKASA